LWCSAEGWPSASPPLWCSAEWWPSAVPWRWDKVIFFLRICLLVSPLIMFQFNLHKSSFRCYFICVYKVFNNNPTRL
jgi:hypothetical protein